MLQHILALSVRRISLEDMTGQTLIAEAGLPAELQEVLHDLRLRDSLKEAASESDYDCACLDFSCSFFSFATLEGMDLKHEAVCYLF